MSEEKEGFVIKDNRSLDEKGDLKEDDTGSRDTGDNEPKDRAAPQGGKGKEQAPPMPEVNFTSLIFSLSSTVLFHLGDIADPQTGETKTDFPLAKHTIDTIAMLQKKTQGNLTEEEQKFTESILADLRWRFVKANK